MLLLVKISYIITKLDPVSETIKLNDEFTIEHIGRFKEVKNHTFVIDVFNILIKNIKSKLILVRTGDLEETIREKVDTLDWMR